MAPRTDRLTWMVALSAFALLLAASPAHGRDILQDAEAAGYKQSSGGPALSKYNAATKRYLPVATDPLYSYYRFNTTWQVLIYDVFDPSPSTPTLSESAGSGLVFDTPSGAQVGSFDITGISTGASAVGPGVLTAYVYNGVVELGPQGDDAITFQGSRKSTFLPPKDVVYSHIHTAIVGGTGQFLGCTGQVLEQYPKGDTTGKSFALFEVIVPRVKSF